MHLNRSAPWARIVPVIRVTDVRAAADWYCEVLELVEHVRIGDSHRVQLGLPGERAELVVAEAREPLSGGEIMVKVEDVEAVLSAARRGGADQISSSHDWEYGERQGGFLDPFGQRWVVTQTLRDTDPADWGGRTIEPRS